MKPEIAKQLASILDGKRQQKQAAAKAEDEQAMRLAKNVADFSEKKQQVIKPAFEEIADLYKAKGLNIFLREQDEERNTQGGITPASIALEMHEQKPAGMTPEFRLIFDKLNRTVSLYTSTRSRGGPAGKSVPLDAITADWIENTFLNYVNVE